MELDLCLTRALEKLPVIEIPEDFAARVASHLPSLAEQPILRGTQIGRNITLVLCLLLLLPAIFLLAPLAQGGSMLWMALEWTLCTQFALLALWLPFRKQFWR